MVGNRPEGWKNPFSEGGRMSGVVNADVKEYAFEAGADAMLEAIKKEIDLEDVEAYGSQCGVCKFLFEGICLEECGQQGCYLPKGHEGLHRAKARIYDLPEV